MLPDEQDPFGEYAPESQTASVPRTEQKLLDEEAIESAKYGIGKPRRVIIRGNVAADRRIENERE